MVSSLVALMVALMVAPTVFVITPLKTTAAAPKIVAIPAAEEKCMSLDTPAAARANSDALNETAAQLALDAYDKKVAARQEQTDRELSKSYVGGFAAADGLFATLAAGSLKTSSATAALDYAAHNAPWVIGGVAVNQLLDQTLWRHQDLGKATAITDVVAPLAVAFLPGHAWMKAGAIVGSHLLAHALDSRIDGKRLI